MVSRGGRENLWEEYHMRREPMKRHEKEMKKRRKKSSCGKNIYTF
jgi:hypothetical protein